MAIKNADVAAPEAPCLCDEAIHHCAMRFKQVLNRKGIELRKKIISPLRIFDFSDVMSVAQYSFSI